MRCRFWCEADIVDKKTAACPQRANDGLFFHLKAYSARTSVTRIFRLNTAPSLDSLNDG